MTQARQYEIAEISRQLAESRAESAALQVALTQAQRALFLVHRAGQLSDFVPHSPEDRQAIAAALAALNDVLG